MNRLSLGALTLVAATTLAPGLVWAGDISSFANGPWLGFTFRGPGVEARGCGPADPAVAPCGLSGNSVAADAPPWTFGVGPLGATLEVVDAFSTGDVFEIFDQGLSLGMTSAAPLNDSCGGDPDECVGTSASYGLFDLPPGEHSITIKAVVSPFNVGLAYLRIDGDVVVGDSLTALSPAKLWVGVKNSDDVGLRLDLKAEVFVNDTSNPPIGTGELDNVSGGSSGFSNATQYTVPLALTGGPVVLSEDDQLLLRISVRRTCSGGGHSSGTARLWYNGEAIDSGANRDAGSRFGVTIDGTTGDLYLRTGFALSTTAGSSRASIDKLVSSGAACPGRAFTPFGTWSDTP